MGRDIQRAIAKSESDFRRLAWPHVRELLGGGELESVDQAAFDIYGGIDVLLCQGSARYGLSVRVQYSPNHLHKTLTICTRTAAGIHPSEWEKRMADDGRVQPKWFVHAYVKDDRLIRCYMAPVRETMDALQDEYLHSKRNGRTGAIFVSPSIALLRRKGVDVLEVDMTQPMLLYQ